MTCVLSEDTNWHIWHVCCLNIFVDTGNMCAIWRYWLTQIYSIYSIYSKYSKYSMYVVWKCLLTQVTLLPEVTGWNSYHVSCLNVLTDIYLQTAEQCLTYVMRPLLIACMSLPKCTTNALNSCMRSLASEDSTLIMWHVCGDYVAPNGKEQTGAQQMLVGLRSNRD